MWNLLYRVHSDVPFYTKTSDYKGESKQRLADDVGDPTAWYEADDSRLENYERMHDTKIFIVCHQLQYLAVRLNFSCWSRAAVVLYGYNQHRSLMAQYWEDLQCVSLEHCSGCPPTSGNMHAVPNLHQKKDQMLLPINRLNYILSFEINYF